MYKLREVSRGNFDDKGYSNEETIAHLMLTQPEEINKTFLLIISFLSNLILLKNYFYFSIKNDNARVLGFEYYQ